LDVLQWRTRGSISLDKLAIGLFEAVSDFGWDTWKNDGRAVKIGVEIVPKIIEENRDAVARDILRDKIEGKGVFRRTAYRRWALAP